MSRSFAVYVEEREVIEHCGIKVGMADSASSGRGECGVGGDESGLPMARCCGRDYTDALGFTKTGSKPEE